MPDPALVHLPPVSPVASDEAIVARILAGDLPAFELLMRRHNQRLYGVARSILRDPDEAEDVVQDAYVRAYEHLAAFRAVAKFSTWLTRIALHEALARKRKARRARSLGQSPTENHAMATGAPGIPDSHTPPADAESSRAELRTLLESAIDTLPQQMRTVFILREVQGLDTAETAACLEVTPANVKVRLHRARALLRATLDETLSAEALALYAFDGARCDRIVRTVLARLTR